MSDDYVSAYLAQLLYDRFFEDRGHEHDAYPQLVVSLGPDRCGDLTRWSYDDEQNVLILHVEEDV